MLARSILVPLAVGVLAGVSPTAIAAQPQIAPPPAAPVARKLAEGDRLMEEKKYRQASFAYLDAVEADRTNVEALFKLGSAFAVLGYHIDAMECWSKVPSLTSDPAVRKSAEDNIARARAKITQLTGLTSQANQGPPPGPPTVDPARAQARSAYEQGVRQIDALDYAGAMQSLTRAIQLEPSLAVAYAARGSANIGLRRYPEALADYESALRLDANLASPLYGLGEACRAMGRLSDARQYYERYGSSSAVDARPELQREARQKATQLR